MSNVVAVADVGELDVAQVAELFFQREEIGERLTRMLEIAESVDDRDLAHARHPGDGCMAERAQNDAVHPAFEIVSDIGERSRASSRFAV